MMMQDINQLVLAYLERGGTVKSVAYRKPRKAEATFPVIRGSIAHAGRKSVALRQKGYKSLRIAA
jgi:hypothetical protein